MTKSQLDLAEIRVKIQRAARQINEANPEKLWELFDILHVQSREGLYCLVDMKNESRR